MEAVRAQLDAKHGEVGWMGWVLAKEEVFFAVGEAIDEAADAFTGENREKQSREHGAKIGRRADPPFVDLVPVSEVVLSTEFS